MEKHLLAAAVLLLLTSFLSARADMLSEAETLIRDGQAEQAYALLEPQEFERAGEPDFDYLLGLAALEAGKPGRATLALERVLLVDPNYAGARLDLGRAYYALGDFTRAKTELAAVRELDPPPAARQTVEKYLAAIDAATTKPAKTVVGGYVDMAGGWDSNVNAANDVSNIFIPFFGLTVGLEPGSVETESGYYGIGLGADVTHRFSAQYSFNAAVSARGRAHTREAAEPSDWSSYNVKLGLTAGPSARAKRSGRWRPPIR